jgi:hypothetical protein
LIMYLSTCAIVSDLSVSMSVSLSLTELQKTSLSDLALSFYLSINLAGYSVCLSRCVTQPNEMFLTLEL